MVKKIKKSKGEERRERERVLGLSRRWRDLHIKWLEIYNGRGPEEVPAIRAINKEPSLRDKRCNLLAPPNVLSLSPTPPTRCENNDECNLLRTILDRSFTLFSLLLFLFLSFFKTGVTFAGYWAGKKMFSSVFITRRGGGVGRKTEGGS